MLVPYPNARHAPHSSPATCPPRRGVAIVPWPSGTIDRARARATGSPCLLVADAGAAPPTDCDLLEDWVSATASDADVRARIDTLAGRPPPVALMAPNVVGTLTDIELLVLGALNRRPGAVTPRDRLAGAAAAAESPADRSALEAALKRLSRKLRRADLELLGIAGGGVVLARCPRPTD